MVKVTVDELRASMDNKHNIRNMSVIAHVDHGKPTLTNSLVAAAGIIAQDAAGDSTGISLLYEMPQESLKRLGGERRGGSSSSYLINLVDSPGHVTAALCITDGALVVTETVLRQALAERIKPVLAVNKMDRCFLKLQQSGEEAYQAFRRVIENANVIAATYEDGGLGDCQVAPEKGTVVFSAGLHGWAFRLPDFARMYAAKFGVDEARMTERLWGEHFFDPATRSWSTRPTGSPTCQRGFVQFCYQPIRQVLDACMSSDDDKRKKLWPMLDKLRVTLRAEDRELSHKALMKRVMQAWLPASAALLEMIVFHLPSPAEAQQYRVETLYEGPLDDAYATGICNCDAEGPLMLYVSKMIPASDKGRFYAFGRVFSGTVATGTKVRIMGPNYVPGGKTDLYVKTVQRTVIWMGKRQESVKNVPCGNTVALVGLDRFITTSATLTDDKAVDAHPMKAMKFSVSPVVHKSVACKNAADLPRLVEGLKRLAKSDPLVTCTVTETGEHVIAGVGELHLEICIKDLQQDFMSGTEIVVGPPIVAYRETVLARSCRTVTSKSPNKHNRLYVEALPLEKELAKAIDDELVSSKDEVKVRAKVLSEEFAWDKDLARKIWCFGPDAAVPNMFVDMCRGVQYVGEVRDSVVAGFQWASKEGALAEESMRGVCFELRDVVLHADAVHRGGAQIIPTARRAIYAAKLTAMPRLMEPVYLERQRPGTPLVNFKAYLPVTESLEFTERLRAETSGEAFPQCVFDHWEAVNSDPLEEGSTAAKLVGDIRRRKGLKDMMPLSEFEDRL
ncbi:hypothetical protein PVAP13_5NG473100 [Panicum virgatum]|uniref:Translation elongation factor EFG/EF2 domain-containing protein n=1 Tax=Panicum virgatum TaxID=38727 RepID=A0A8T0S229_PANVG|nr:hypothetical protein PVAP13_5NG473100 [Panicum virgatum]